MLKYISIIIIYIFISYFISKNNLIINNNYVYKKKKNIKVLTYNIQRLPYLLRPMVNFNFLDYDIICFQECFMDIMNLRNDYFEMNCCIPKSNYLFLIDSGLVILSKFKINYIDFITYKNMKSVDKLAQKGFLVCLINDILIINTHCQACYNKDNKLANIVNKQLEQINNYIENIKHKYKDILVVGDFNKCLTSITDFKGIKLQSTNPTIYDDELGLISKTSPNKKYKNQKPKWLDGGFMYGNLDCKSIKTVQLDNLTDHSGVEMNIIKY